LPVLISIAAALVLAPILTLSPQLVQAQQDKQIYLPEDYGYGVIFCGPQYDYREEAWISFLAREKNGRVSGFLSFVTNEAFPDEISGGITGIQMNGEKSFTLTGTLNDPCEESRVPFILTGECGPARKSIHFTTTETGLRGDLGGRVVCNIEDLIQKGSFTVSQTATSSNLPKAVPGFAVGSHQIAVEVAANYEYNTATKALTVDQDSLKGQLWIDKGTSNAKSFPLSDVTALSVSPDLKIITYKANIKFGGTLIVGTVTGTLTFDPAIDFEHAKDQSAKTNKMTLEISIAKVKLEVQRALTGGIDFT
jgi:hypothetical protein